MATSHRRQTWWERRKARRRPKARPRRPVELVDADTLLAHLLTREAFDAGCEPEGRYVALCGAEVLPAALVTPGRGHCDPCREAVAA